MITKEQHDRIVALVAKMSEPWTEEKQKADDEYRAEVNRRAGSVKRLRGDKGAA